MQQQRLKVLKFISCMLKDIMSIKTMKELCMSGQFSFVFLSTGNLLKFFLVVAKIERCG